MRAPLRPIKTMTPRPKGLRDGPTTLLIVPAATDLAGQARIVAYPGKITDALKSYRSNPDEWYEAGHINSRGKLVSLDADRVIHEQIQECEPLMAGLYFHFDTLHPIKGQQSSIGSTSQAGLFAEPPAPTHPMTPMSQRVDGAGNALPPVKILAVLFKAEGESGEDFAKRARLAQPSPYHLPDDANITGECVLSFRGLVRHADFAKLSSMCVVAAYGEAHAETSHALGLPYQREQLIHAIEKASGGKPLHEIVPPYERDILGIKAQKASSSIRPR